jgi:hypothetical protein
VVAATPGEQVIPVDAPGTTMHRCFGLVVDSEIPLSDVGPDVPPGTPADVTVRLGSAGRPVEADALPLGLWRSADAIGLVVPDTAGYVVRGGREIVVEPVPGADPLEVRLFLLGTVMGALMMQRGHLVLHGNAFRFGDACAVVVGHSGAGKSTLAAELQRRGHEVLSDDVVPVDRDGTARPGYPRIKLWADAVTRLGVDPAGLDRVVSKLDKFELPLTRTRVEPLPLRWVYVLERHTGPGLSITPAGGMETFSLLHEHTYRKELVHGDEVVRAHLDLCARVAGRARISRVTRPVETMTAEATADAILADIAATSDPVAGAVEESA